MTLLLRRKRPTTARNTLRSIPFKLVLLQNLGRNANQLFAIATACLLGSQTAGAQQWQPTRVSPTSQAQPLSNAPQQLPSSFAVQAATNPSPFGQASPTAQDARSLAEERAGVNKQLGNGIVLRWRTSSSNTSSNSSTSNAFSSNVGNHTGTHTGAQIHATSEDSFGNPLRSASAAQFQAPTTEQPTVQTASDLHPIDRYQSPQLQYRTAQSAYYQETPSDPLDAAESAPVPPVDQSNILPQLPEIQSKPFPDPPSFPPQLGDEVSPADRQPNDQNQSLSPSPEPLPALPPKQEQSDSGEDEEQESEDALEELLKEARIASTPDCVTQREQLKGQPLTSISLDVSPKIGDGLRSIKKQSGESQERKNEVDKKSLLREWTDYRGDPLGSGRMTDLRFGNVILDMGGQERAIPVANLSDVDMNYVSELWNLPFRCGSGFEPLEGRQFVNSTVQWKASGSCNNPLYFEQVQLERYGHEAGPVLQPLVSSAHFFMTIPMLPYKMAINPPNECQYALGYYRPGNCAPYMVQPFPWSVKAGLVQAGFWTGASALVP